MAYGFVTDVPAPIQFYDALHAEIGRRGGGDGLLVHIGRPTRDVAATVRDTVKSLHRRSRHSAGKASPLLGLAERCRAIQ